MKLKHKEYQWIYEKCEEMQRAVAALDYARSKMTNNQDDVYKKADAEVSDLALSFLMVSMGEHIPKTLWSVKDYSDLYNILDGHRDEIELTDDV